VFLIMCRKLKKLKLPSFKEGDLCVGPLPHGCMAGALINQALATMSPTLAPHDMKKAVHRTLSVVSFTSVDIASVERH